MENNILSIVANNPALIEAVKRAIKAEFEITSFKDEVSDEQIGQVVRAQMKGLEAVDRAFTEITRYKTIPTATTTVNPAR